MKLFERAYIGGLPLRNRFVRSATGERLAAAEGRCTPALIDVIRRVAKGGVGLILPGHAYVSSEGRSDPQQMGLHDDGTLEGLSRLTGAAHDEGAAVFAQLTHAGAKADGGRGKRVEELTHEDIENLVLRFGEAAERARRAGFDGVQIHVGHGYGLCQFVSPFLNARADEYGGPLENRMRVVLEIYREARRRVGGVYPVIAKMNCDDFIDGGTTPDIMVRAARMLEVEGLDAVEMSGGIGHPKARFGGARNHDPKTPDEEVYYREAAREYKKQLRMPLILVGGIRTFETAAGLVGDGVADFVSLCRPLIREPDLVARWQRGDTRRAACVSCNGCGKAAAEGGIRCVLENS